MSITNTYVLDPIKFTANAPPKASSEYGLYIDFVGGPYRVRGLNKQQQAQLKNHFAQACTVLPQDGKESAAGVVDIYVHSVADENFHRLNPPPQYRSFELEADKNQVRIAGENMFGQIDMSGTFSGHLWTVMHEEYFHSNTFENFFRMLVTYRLMACGGMLLHSAGIVSRNEAYLFPGRSGDGKSTLSKLSINEGRTVLSDDMNAVTWHEGQPFVEKVPFTGDLKRDWVRSRSYPLKAIFAINKSSVTSIENLPGSRALTLLTSCTPYINADTHRMSQLLENHYRLTQKVPAHILNFSLSGGGIWRAIETSLDR